MTTSNVADAYLDYVKYGDMYVDLDGIKRPDPFWLDYEDKFLQLFYQESGTEEFIKDLIERMKERIK